MISTKLNWTLRLVAYVQLYKGGFEQSNNNDNFLPLLNLCFYIIKFLLFSLIFQLSFTICLLSPEGGRKRMYQ